MRIVSWAIAFVAFPIFVSAPMSATAQDWLEYENRDYGFAINFPSEPTFEDREYVSPTGETLPARVFTSTEGDAIYKVTVVDFSSRPGEQHIAVSHAADAMRASGEVIYEAISDLDEIYGPQFYIFTEDQREKLSTIVFYRENLLIAEGRVPQGSAPPSQFQQSMGLVNADGTRPTGVNEDRIARQKAFEEERARQLREQQ